MLFTIFDVVVVAIHTQPFHRVVFNIIVVTAVVSFEHNPTVSALSAKIL